jgi:hypothetical protein
MKYKEVMATEDEQQWIKAVSEEQEEASRMAKH